jgi:hypothetical protein
MENKLSAFLKSWLTPSLLLGSIMAGAYALGEFKKSQEARSNELKEVTFDNSSQKHKMLDYVTADFNPVSVFLQGDSLLDIGITMNKTIEQQNNLLEEIHKEKVIEAKRKKTQDSLLKIENELLKINREEKYALQQKILRQLEVIDLRQRDFKIELEKLKNNQ